MAKSTKKITGKQEAETASVPFHNIRRETSKDITDTAQTKKAKPVTEKKTVKKSKPA